MADHDRFTALYQAHYDEVLRYALRRAEPETARDVADETFLVAWRRLADMPVAGDAALWWLFSVARNTLATSARASLRRDRLAARLGQLTGRRSAADLAAEIADRMLVHDALARLPDRDQEILRLIGWEELDLRAVAAVIGCTPSAAAVRAHRARRRLAGELRKLEGSAGLLSASATSSLSAVVRQELS